MHFEVETSGRLQIVQATDSHLFIANGEHFIGRDMAQTLDNDLGKIVRITPTGEIPKDNPFVGQAGARPEIWSYGHRNPQGLARNPADGSLWEQEHGARGGDEINIIVPGKNYGWPKVSYGVNYDGSPVGTGKQQMEGITDPIWHWTPSIAPSGMTFYTGNLFPSWKGSLFNGALRGSLLSRLEIKDNKVVHEERMMQDFGERIRDVRQGPDGAIYLVTDNSAGRHHHEIGLRDGDTRTVAQAEHKGICVTLPTLAYPLRIHIARKLTDAQTDFNR